MLTPDPQRQWFVYFNEKELGPFAEKELLSKIAQGELNNSAYVFTEGMTDWALISDTPVLYKTGPKIETSEATSQWKEQSTKSKVAAQGDPANPFEDLLTQSGAPSAQKSKDSLVLETPAENLQSKTQTAAPAATVQTSAAQSKSTSSFQGSEFTGSGVKSSAGSLSRPLSGTNSGVAKTSAEATIRQPLSEAAVASAKKQATKPNRALLLVLLLVIVGAAVYYWQTQMQPSQEYAETPASEEQAPSDPSMDGTQVPADGNGETAANGDGATSAASNVAVAQGQNGSGISDADWAKLVEFRSLKDQKGPPYMLAPNAIGTKFPIVMGVLSPLIEADQVFLAVFPDPEKSLMAVPKIWYMRASVLDGFFSAGPMNLESKELPPGRYKVLVQISDAFLGETSFELGQWPDAGRLAELKLAMENETKNLAAQEREALGAKLKEVKAALSQLKAKSSAAVKGPRGANEWKAFSKAWYESLLKAIRDQKSVTVGPMFYPAQQLKLLNFMENVRSLQESYTLVSRGGAKMLAKVRNKNLGKELAAINKEEAAISTDFSGLDKVPAQPLVISAENVKKGLEYFVSTGFK